MEVVQVVIGKCSRSKSAPSSVNKNVKIIAVYWEWCVFPRGILLRDTVHMALVYHIWCKMLQATTSTKEG